VLRDANVEPALISHNTYVSFPAVVFGP